MPRCVIPLAVLVAAAGCAANKPARVATGSASVEVMTYNVNYALAGDRAAIAAIRAEDADLVLLQETTAAWERSLRAELGEQYAHLAFLHSRGAGGQAVLSKHTIIEQDVIDPPDGGWFPAWRLEVDSPVGRIQVLAVHLRPQLSERGSFVSGYFTTPRVRSAEIAKYFAHLDADKPTLVVGDFNEGQRGLAIGYLERRGFRSGLGQFESSDTWRWPTSVGTVGAELDHLVYRAPLTPVSVRVVKAGRSDHLPVVGRFVVD